MTDDSGKKICTVCLGDAFDHFMLGDVIFWCDNGLKVELK
jgi:hypothetical protein